MPRSFLSILSFAALLPVVACSSSTSAPPPAIDSGASDTSSPAPDATPISGSCTLSCAGVAECVSSSSQCASGYCLGDSTGSYCTRSCETEPCPAGYECRAVEGIGAPDMRACVALPAVCGNNVKERGEVCDDGNTIGEDGCSADCKKLEGPPPPEEKLAFNLTFTSSNASILASGTVAREDSFGPPPSSIACGTETAEPAIGLRGSVSIAGKSAVYETVDAPFCDDTAAARVTMALAYLPGDYVGNQVYGSAYQPLIAVTAVARTSGGVDCNVFFTNPSSPTTTVHVDAPSATSIAGRVEAELTMREVRARGSFPSPAEESACADLESSFAGATVRVQGTFTRSGVQWKIP